MISVDSKQQFYFVMPDVYDLEASCRVSTLAEIKLRYLQSHPCSGNQATGRNGGQNGLLLCLLRFLEGRRSDPPDCRPPLRHHCRSLLLAAPLSHDT